MSTTFRVLRQFYKYNHHHRTVAAALGMGFSTLRYKLKQEGTTFTKLLKRWRLRWLDTYLAEGKSAMCISYELGYESMTRFYEWFKEV